jgi:hypothetical protein
MDRRLGALKGPRNGFPLAISGSSPQDFLQAVER